MHTNTQGSKVMTTINMLKQDAQEGINAFLNHRDPQWEK